MGEKFFFIKVKVLSEDFPVAVATKEPFSHFSVDLEVMSDGELLARKSFGRLNNRWFENAEK